MTPSPDLVAAVEGMRRFGSYGMPLIKAIEDYFREGVQDIATWDELHARVLTECGTFPPFTGGADPEGPSGVPLVGLGRPSAIEFWVNGTVYRRPDLETLHKATQATTAKTWLKHDTRYPTPRKKNNEHQS
ncbi:hypothetical protein KVA01_14980 [Kocuria varians]|uniref:Uncharacterized protein n=1 Tax=Kocuria varians TaxID=1272 RepID=A0A4Y4D6V8_KOCVA|nr:MULTISPECIES: hypothetical protein [Kocuria]MCT1457920.1 hypothetical protein [Kocuria rhizophila]GEC99343.1 hypothetical protein KVA01_14980 [Kocuria varians]